MSCIEGFMTCNGNGDCVWKAWVKVVGWKLGILRENAVQIEGSCV